MATTQDRYKWIGKLLFHSIVLFLIGWFIVIQIPILNTIRLTLVCLIVLVGVPATMMMSRKKESTSAEDEMVDEEYTEEQNQEEELTQFEQWVREALDSIPENFHQYMENLEVIVEDEASSETLQMAGVPEGGTLFGLYHGVPFTKYGSGRFASLPMRITIYQKPIEQYGGGDLERTRAQVRATVLHEVAHHFGMDHDDMPTWVK